MNAKRICLGALAILLAVVTVPIGVGAVAIPFPGGLPSLGGEHVQVAVHPAAAEASVDGRLLRVIAVTADPEQTAIGYEFVGRAEDGDFVTIAPRPRLVLDDGSLVPFIGNAAAGSREPSSSRPCQQACQRRRCSWMA